MFIIAVIAALGCGDPEGQGTEAAVVCAPVQRTPLAFDEASALGFAASDALANLGGTSVVQVQWADDTVTDGTVSLSYDGGTIELQEREWMGTGDGAAVEPAIDCADVVSIEVAVTLATSDGRLGEAWMLALELETATRAALVRELDSITGSLDVESFAPPGEFTAVRAFVQIAWADGLPAGRIDGQAEGEDGDTAFAQSFDIAILGEPPQ